MEHAHRRIRHVNVVCLALVLLVSLFGIVAAGGVAAGGASAATNGPRVLYVGSFGGIATPKSSTFKTIQAAVDAAKPSDWILIAPGDYHEKGDMGADAPSGSDVSDGWYGGVDIATPRIHLRGMNRNSVIVDGTLAKASTPCSAAASDQNTLGGKGRNGILIWKANGVSVENLTVCNFLAGTGNAGNEIWWNGGAGSSKIGLSGYSGNYLTATSTYFKGSDPTNPSVCARCALYGIFSSDATGPAFLTNTYANKSVTVTATSADGTAVLALSFNNGSSYSIPLTTTVASGSQTLGLPTNTVAVRAVSQDLSQTNVYTVNVLLQPSLTVPHLTNSVSGSTLALSWPADHLGYRLLVQTNNLNKGVSGNTNDWGTVAGTTTLLSTNIAIIKTGVTNEYYKLIYP